MSVIFYQNTDNQGALPGMNRVLWAPLDIITGFPVIPATGFAAGDTITAIGDFTFATGNGWLQIFNDQLKGSDIEQKSIGDPAAPGIDSTGKARVLGMTSQLFEQYNRMLGIPAIMLFQDAQCNSNEWWVMGCSCDPAFFTFEFKSGAKGGNEVKGTTLEFKSAQNIYKYTGAITIAPFIIISVTITSS